MFQAMFAVLLCAARRTRRQAAAAGPKWTDGRRANQRVLDGKQILSRMHLLCDEEEQSQLSCGVIDILGAPGMVSDCRCRVIGRNSCSNGGARTAFHSTAPLSPVLEVAVRGLHGRQPAPIDGIDTRGCKGAGSRGPGAALASSGMRSRPRRWCPRVVLLAAASPSSSTHVMCNAVRSADTKSRVAAALSPAHAQARPSEVQFTRCVLEDPLRSDAHESAVANAPRRLSTEAEYSVGGKAAQSDVMGHVYAAAHFGPSQDDILEVDGGQQEGDRGDLTDHYKSVHDLLAEMRDGDSRMWHSHPWVPHFPTSFEAMSEDQAWRLHFLPHVRKAFEDIVSRVTQSQKLAHCMPVAFAARVVDLTSHTIRDHEQHSISHS